MSITYSDLLSTTLALESIRTTGEGVLSAKDVDALQHWLALNIANMGPHTGPSFAAVLRSHENLRTEKLLVSILPTE